MTSPEASNDVLPDDLEASNRVEISLSDPKDDGENLEAIKKFIEEQEKEILQLEAEVKPGPSLVETLVHVEKDADQIVESNEPTDEETKNLKQETVENVVGSANVKDDASVPPDIKCDVMDVILSDPNAKGKSSTKSPKKCFSPGAATGSMALGVGSRVEAKDFSELWYPAEVVEVDYEEMEVLVRYEGASKKHDEWISVSSPRLRPQGSGADDVTESMTSYDEAVAEIIPKEEIKKEFVEKQKLTFKVGERCLARWRDNRKFLAFVSEDLGDDQYKIKFDDGTDWQCNVTRLCKMRESFPVLDHTPTAQNVPATLPYNTHLFDPSRDYLGSKSERRALKRKLNIKEILNIGQKKKKEDTPKKPKIIRKKSTPAPFQVKEEIKTDPGVSEVIPDAVASIIGATKQDTETEEPKTEPETAPKTEPNQDTKEEPATKPEVTHPVEKAEVPVKEDLEMEVVEPVKEMPQMRNMKVVLEKIDVSKVSTPVRDEEMEVVTIDVNEGDLDSSIDEGDHKVDLDDSFEESILAAYAAYQPPTTVPAIPRKDRITLKIGKDKIIQKPKKKKLSHEEKVKSKVEKVKSEIAEMKLRMEEMKKQSKIKSSQPFRRAPISPLPASVLLPGQWCCRWVDGQPVGSVSELRAAHGLPRRSVQVEDHRLPSGWSKHMVRRCSGHSAGKWDVVLEGPGARRFHNKTDMKNYMEAQPDDSLRAYEDALMDFGAHRKLSRRLGWEVMTEDYEPPAPEATPPVTSPPVKRKSAPGAKKKSLSLKKKAATPLLEQPTFDESQIAPVEYQPPLEEGYVWVGSLKVQVLENLLRCPADGCYKNFRNNTLLQLHVKHYHRQLVAAVGAAPRVLDLASARTKAPPAPGETRTPKTKSSKTPRGPEEVKTEIGESPLPELAATPENADKIPRSQDSPRLRNALINSKSAKRPKVLLPIRKFDDTDDDVKPKEESVLDTDDIKEEVKEETMDFEAAISSHLVTKESSKKSLKKKLFASVAPPSGDESSDCDGRSQPLSGSERAEAAPLLSSESNDAHQYMLTETGEKVKIVHMKREEIINCHCGLREEDGLMIQCELCLCWQHALCHNIQREAEVPEKYTCSICLNPRRGRRSRRFLHDQDRLYEGLLPGAAPSEGLRRAHELAGNLLRVGAALRAARVQLHVAAKKDHPKLYLWAREWDGGSLRHDLLDLGALVRDLGKENMPAPDRDLDRDRSGGGLSGLLSSPGGVSLDLALTTADLETLAKSVQESELVGGGAPVPEAAIEDGACRQRLLQHVQRCQAAVDARLDSIEAQVAELESQDPSFEDDETADFFPRTKQTIQMLLRDLDVMEELGVAT